MRNLFSTLLVTLIVLSFTSCENDDEPDEIIGGVNIYLIDSYKKVGNSFEINESDVITESTPLIGYADIISYNKKSYTYIISENAQQALRNLEVPLDGLAFAVKANNELIYTAYFWTPLSSMSCDWLLTESIFFSHNNEIDLTINIGYPTEASSIPDKRNDNRILEIFRRDNKLIE